ncbi:MAG: STAS domain-containing protein [Hamadaea sp.]|nr:STAS domain-containing protein [Hamadaea sp.]
MNLSVTPVRGDGVVTVEVRGDVDLVVKEVFGAELTEIIRRARADADCVDVDLSGVDLLDSTGLAALLMCRRVAVANGVAFRVSAASPPVRKTLVVTGVWPLLAGDEL